MPYRYGRDWHGVLREPIQEITEQAARKRFIARSPHFSVSKVEAEGEVPEYTLRINPLGPYVGVLRYNEWGSEILTYHFDETEERPGQLFLGEVNLRVYPDGQNRWLDLNQTKAHSTFRFWPDGNSRVRDTVAGQPMSRVQEFRDVPVDDLWVPMIEFGQWDQIAQPIDFPDPS